jgi:hypothetical protein
MVDVPTVVADVNVAVYVPLALSTTVPIEPDDGVRVTTPPLIVRLLLNASFNCTLIVDVVTPLARIDVGDAVMTD